MFLLLLEILIMVAFIIYGLVKGGASFFIYSSFTSSRISSVIFCT